MGVIPPVLGSLPLGWVTLRPSPALHGQPAPSHCFALCEDRSRPSLYVLVSYVNTVQGRFPRSAAAHGVQREVTLAVLGAFLSPDVFPVALSLNLWSGVSAIPEC